MTRFFLKLKHWQFFILTVGLPFILDFVFVGTIIVKQEFPGVMMALIPILMLLVVGGLIGWMFSIGYRFGPLLPEEAKMKTVFFKFACIFPLLYMLFIFLGMVGLISSLQQGEEPNLVILGFILPAHLLAMFCMFYMLYFSSKTLKAVELQRKVVFADYAGEFFMMWFFPVGIWILQPRINKIYREQLESTGH